MNKTKDEEVAHIYAAIPIHLEHRLQRAVTERKIDGHDVKTKSACVAEAIDQWLAAEEKRSPAKRKGR